MDRKNPVETPIFQTAGSQRLMLLEGLPTNLREHLGRTRRLILVANNPAIGGVDIGALDLGAEDVVVGFNLHLKAALLPVEPIHVLVHGYNKSDAHFFGLPLQGGVAKLFAAQPSRRFSILLAGYDPICPIPGVGFYQGRLPLEVLQDYPRVGPVGRTIVGPTTGFTTMVLFDWLRRECGYGYDLYALGFSNEAGKLWSGHAWDYEREWLQRSEVRQISLARSKGGLGRLLAVLGRNWKRPA